MKPTSLFTYEIHFACYFHQFSAYGSLDGIAANGMVGISTVRGLHEFYVLRVRPYVVAKSDKGFIVFDATLGNHPSAIDAILHVAVHLAEKGKPWSSQCFFVEIEVHVYPRLFAEEMSFKRALRHG